MQLDRDELIAAIGEALDARHDKHTITREEHHEHHSWVREQIERQRARNEFWTALAAKSLPAIIWTGLAAAAASLWGLVKDHIHWR